MCDHSAAPTNRLYRKIPDAGMKTFIAFLFCTGVLEIVPELSLNVQEIAQRPQTQFGSHRMRLLLRSYWDTTIRDTDLPIPARETWEKPFWAPPAMVRQCPRGRQAERKLAATW